MRPDTYQMQARRQKDYWWHRARRQMAVALLRRFGVAAGGKWLDVGCGAGGNLGVPSRFCAEFVVGLDISPIAMELAAKSSCCAHLVQADGSRGLPFVDSSFDVATVFNVLSHDWIKDDQSALREVSRVLRPNGMILITEPAFEILSREMDEVGMSSRRYRRPSFMKLCKGAGFNVLFASYFTCIGFPILLASKVARRLSPRRRLMTAPDLVPLTPVVNETMFKIAAAESYLISQGARMPFGTTLVCVGQKSS